MKDMNWPERVAYLENQLADSDRDNQRLREFIEGLPDGDEIVRLRGLLTRIHGIAAEPRPVNMAVRLENIACIASWERDETYAQLAEEQRFLHGAAADAVEVERLQRLMQKIMARCADLLDEDQFNELDAMVGGICDAWVIAPAQKTLTDLARETNYQPSRYEAHLEARLADAEALLRDARSSIPGNAKFTLRRIDDFLRAGVTTVTVPVAPEAK